VVKQEKIHTKSEMRDFFFDDPVSAKFSMELNETSVDYFYFENNLRLKTGEQEVMNSALLKGKSKLIHNDTSYDISQFDFLFLPPNTNIEIIPKVKRIEQNKICVVKTPIINTDINPDAKFEIQKFNFQNFVDRGELSDSKKMATFRTVWTAFKNGYFMSGFTNIPNKSLKQGVVTSVNLEKKSDGSVEIYPHVHHGFPEVYIFCISDNTTAISQYLVNESGESVVMERFDGEGLFFPGHLGHINFVRPTYKNLDYCLYMWIIGTHGKKSEIEPVTLRV
jgi:hypothetical protein